jgi:4-diphosphocytidyl-2-C-methyl-D-erythritol kinase
LQQLSGKHLPASDLRELGARLGSDCPLFLEADFCLIRGRGEHVTPVSEALRNRLQDYRLLLVLPSFSVNTGWAYSQFARSSLSFSREAELRRRVDLFEKKEVGIDSLLSNDFEPIVGGKFLAFAEAAHQLRLRGVPMLLSGSGSAFFCISQNQTELADSQVFLEQAMGCGISCIETGFTSR